MSEIKLKRKFREVVNVWSETYETRSGGGVGYPDLQLLVHSILVPVELKKGLVHGDRLYPSAVRPSQIGWHHNFYLEGGKSYIVCLWAEGGKLEAWAIPTPMHRWLLGAWRQGYPVADCVQWVSKGKLVIDLVDLLPKINEKG